MIVGVKREVGDDAEVLKMIRVSPVKKDDQMIRRYSKIQTPALPSLPSLQKGLSRLQSMDAARPHDPALLQEVDERRMTHSVLPNPHKIMAYKSQPLKEQDSQPSKSSQARIQEEFRIKRMESADSNSDLNSLAPPNSKQTTSPLNNLLDQQTIQETEEENASSMVSGKSHQSQNFQAMLAEIQRIGQKIDACNENLTELKQSQAAINERLDNRQPRVQTKLNSFLIEPSQQPSSRPSASSSDSFKEDDSAS